jgi:hypothetical protein
MADLFSQFTTPTTEIVSGPKGAAPSGTKRPKRRGLPPAPVTTSNLRELADTLERRQFDLAMEEAEQQRLEAEKLAKNVAANNGNVSKGGRRKTIRRKLSRRR